MLLDDCCDFSLSGAPGEVEALPSQAGSLPQHPRCRCSGDLVLLLSCLFLPGLIFFQKRKTCDRLRLYWSGDWLLRAHLPSGLRLQSHALCQQVKEEIPN